MVLENSKNPHRKSCHVCNKFIYLHHPVLFCSDCEQVFHGKCLKLNNNIVFNLQQTDWFCSKCSTDKNRLTCHCCKSYIFINSEKFSICKNCFLPTHETCLFSKSCLLCISEFDMPETRVINYNVCNNLNNLIENVNELPYLTPFGVEESNNLHDLVEPDNIYDKLISNNRILKSCEYYSVERFIHNYKTQNYKDSLTQLSLNIDGFKSNFDKFLIFNRSLSLANIKISCIALCETNITTQESDKYYIDGYNKFIL